MGWLWRSGQQFCEIVRDKFEEQTKKIDTIDIKAIKQQEVIFSVMHHMLLSSSIHLLWLAAQNASVKQLLLICGHWAVPARRIMFFFSNFKLLYWLYICLLPLNMTFYIYTYLCAFWSTSLQFSLRSTYFQATQKTGFKPLAWVLWKAKKGHQKRRGAMVFPEDETLASLDFLQSDLHLSWRLLMEFTSIGTIKNTENISHDLLLKGWWLKKQRATYVNKFEWTYLNSHWMRTTVSLHTFQPTSKKHVKYMWRKPTRLWLKPLHLIPLLSRLCTLIYPSRSHQQLPKKSPKSTLVCQWLQYFLFWTFYFA